MNMFLTLAFLFFIGSVVGWTMELFFRRYLSGANPERKWINPGFCMGPYLPIYGFGLCLMYLIARVEGVCSVRNPILNKILFFCVMAICMTVVEYIGGIITLKAMKLRLWDYSKEWGNIQGIICPKYSLIWALLGAVYYFFIHPYILDALVWLSQNLAFSFVIGLFFGVFILDAANSVQLVSKIKQYAEENEVIVKYETLKSHIRMRSEKRKQRYHFFRPFLSDISIGEHIAQLRDSFEKKKHRIMK